MYNKTFEKSIDTRGGALPEKIYNRLQVLRAERGLSRQALAEAVEVNYQTIGYLERGDYNPSLELAFRLADFFELPIEAIFSTKPLKPLSESLYANRNGQVKEER